jgi:tetratricopeptide (TPR) repeat protein
MRVGIIMTRATAILLGLMLAAVFAFTAAQARADENTDTCFKEDGQPAIDACTRAIDSKKFSGATLATIYNNRGIELRQSQDYDRAIADYGQAIRIDAEFTGAYTGRGLAYEGKGETEKAKADYRKVLAMPQKYQDGQWAQDTARERLAALDTSK